MGVPSIVQRGAIFSLARHLSMALMSARNDSNSKINSLPISGHCAPWPVKTKTVGIGGPDFVEVETSKDVPSVTQKAL